MSADGPQRPSTLVIINPISGPTRRGRSEYRIEQARSTLSALGVAGDVRLTSHTDHAYQLAVEGIASGKELLVAWGGDGTINEVGKAIVGSGRKEVALGIVPGGSGNGLARELRIPFKPAAALERAVRSPIRTIDAGELGGHLFFNIAGVGLDGHVAEIVATQLYKRGLIPYLLASGRDLLRYRPVPYVIQVGGTSFQKDALIVALANSRQYGFGARIAPEASYEDGLLELVVVEDRGVLGNFSRLPSVFTSTAHKQPGVTTKRVREVVIRSERPMLFHVDGEPVHGGTEIAGRVHPRALQIRA